MSKKQVKEKKAATTVEDLGFTNVLMIDALQKKQKEEEREEIIQEDCSEECEEPVEIVVASKTISYLVCPFCETRQLTTHGSDSASSWCEKCGKCFMVEWKQEQVKI